MTNEPQLHCTDLGHVRGYRYSAIRVSQLGKAAAHAALFLAMSVSTGCASLSSTEQSGSSAILSPGLYYFLPEQAIKITLTVTKTGNDVSYAVSALPSDPYPDHTNRYLLRLRRNWAGKSSLTIGTTASGLLISTDAITTTGLSEALQALASSAAVNAASLRSDDSGAACAAPGTYVDFVTVAEVSEIVRTKCGLEVLVTPLAARTTDLVSNTPSVSAASRRNGSRRSNGIYYRRTLPYRVEIQDAKRGISGGFLIHSPSGSPTLFLPIARSLFATSSGKLVFENGSPTTYNQQVDGEIQGLFKIPADVVSAYFTAIGDLFNKRKTDAANEKAYLDAIRDLELQRLKTQECLEAISSGDSSASENACSQ